jgi:large repetitive protein
MRTHVFLPVSMLSAMLFTALACGGDDVAGAPNNVAGGSSGASGTAGAGNGGASGMTQAGNGGSSGSSAGASGAGNGGASGTAGTAGQGGSSGSSGTAGVGGMSGSGGGSPVIDPPPVTEQCNTNLVKPAGGTVCEMTKTGNTARVIRGRVVGTDKIYEGGEILVDGQGIIQCLGCDCSQNSAYGAATVVTCAEGVVTPALINTHDHITFAQNSPKVHTAKYDHRHEWRKGLNGKPKISVGS